MFFEFTGFCGIELIPISAKIAETAAKIRAEYRDFKAMDSLQLAAAIESGCDVFLTNDKQLKQCSLIKCITLEEWE